VTALGEAQLPDRVRQVLERTASSRDVILGIRPEHFEDASLVGDKPGATFDAPIDIVEAMGSDIYAYFTVKGEEAHSRDLDDLAKDTGNDLRSDGIPITARLDAASRVQRGRTARLWYDTSKVQVFDVASGKNLVAAVDSDPET
jgi:multiple sugar transport system ATP-binding protein